uniref:DNA mismatch repair proteins mutS family domain-containing protein n=1 Tax=viral metagenome TaxID=1070528 RepID=A0A6C0EWG2_9ZZZZ
MALVKEYFELTNKYQSEYGTNTILLMQVGSFHETYALQDKTTSLISGSQIEDFSRICDLNIASKNISIGNASVVMAGFGCYMIDKYIKKMQEAGYTIVVYNQDEQKSNTTRSLAGIFSPGTYFSHDAIKITNNTTCIWINVVEPSILTSKYFSKKNGSHGSGVANKKMVYVGLANINIYTGETSIFEFKETYLNSPTTFDELERFISIYNPCEVIIIANVTDKEIDNIISYANIQCSTIHKMNLLTTTTGTKSNTEIMQRVLNSEKQNYQKALLERFYSISDFSVFSQNFYENAIATQAFCFLLDFIYQHNPNLVNKISEPKFENSSDRLILANHSLKQLNIIDDNTYTGKYSSVEKMLNLCLTSMGKRRFSYNLLNPSTNVTYLQQEYDITEYILAKYSDYEFLKTNLSIIKDISKLNRQIFIKKISPKSLCQFYNNLHVIKTIFTSCQSDSTLMTYLHAKKVSNSFGSGTGSGFDSSSISTHCDQFIQFLQNNMAIELCEEIDSTQQFEVNFIKKGVDVELDEKMELLSESNDKLEAIRFYLNERILECEKSAKTAKTAKIKNDYVKLHETEKNSFSLLATKRRCQILKQSLSSLCPTATASSIILSYTSSYNGQAKVFEFICTNETIECFTQSTSNDCITSSQIKEICKNISTIKIQMKDLITNIYLQILTKLEGFQEQFDSIIDFVTTIDVVYAKASIARKYNYCKPEIINASKSFVDAKDLRHSLIEHLQQNELYVANDIALGRGSVDGVLLYGTNAVGKTSFIRALGIAVILAQSGLYVPCSSFQFCPYKYIFTRILGNDNIFKGLSTFAVEMSELRTILRLADGKSLILGDELCSGTESISAISIFTAGVKTLHSKQSSFIFATHLHEIIHYDEIRDAESVVLKHMAVIYDREKDILVYDRKLRDGPGDNMYGLEVCRSLNLPEDFLTMAHNIRTKYNSESASILSLKTSHFNNKKLMGMCEMCNENMSVEVHHLQHQSYANEDGIINQVSKGGSIFHKNHIANLMSVCETCHGKFHKDKDKDSEVMHKKVKTSKKHVLVGAI